MDWIACRNHLIQSLPTILWPRLAPAGWEPRELSVERAGEVALARWACHDPSARAEVLTRLEATLRGWMRMTNYPRSLRDDAVQVAAVAVIGPPSRLTEYSGTGPLQHWLTVISVRLALNLRRSEARSLAVEPLPDASGDQGWELLVASTPELKVLRRDAVVHFKLALEASLATLTDRDRALLAMRYTRGTEIGPLAQMYRVHRVTMSGWITEARERLRIALLSRLDSIEEKQVELRHWLGTQPELSLSRLLSAIDE